MSDVDVRLLDKRTAERYMRLGLLDEKAWEKHLKSLADSAENAAPVEATLVDTDEDDDDAED